jgi:hypothetical protein
MEEEKSAIGSPAKSALAFECDGCNEAFESLERLRQHQVDCKSDDSEEWL